MASNIKDKTALVTGGANGIGFHYVEELLRHNAKRVAILDLANSNGERAVAKLESEFGKGRVIFLVCDVTNVQQLEASFNQVFKLFNGLDIFINNAGILNEAKWELMININLIALIRASILAIELMGKQNGGKGGTLVNVASIAGFMDCDLAPCYGATKHGVIGFSRSLKCFYDKTGVRVLIMCPGFTNTTLVTDKSNRFFNFFNHSEAIEKLALQPLQPTEHVAKAMIELIEKGKNGTICVSDPNEPPYVIKFPEYQTLKKPL